MISRYNLIQTLKAVLAILGGTFCLWLAYLFFRHVPSLIAHLYGGSIPPVAIPWIVMAGMLVVLISGYRLWKEKGGTYGYHHSALYHDLGDEHAGALLVDHYTHRITAPAYLISQIFLAGPLLLLKAVTLIASRIPNSAGLENRLIDSLTLLRAANKWQALADYPDRRTEILYLARMGMIDFSDSKGAPRIKADRSDGA